MGEGGREWKGKKSWGSKVNNRRGIVDGGYRRVKVPEVEEG